MINTFFFKNQNKNAKRSANFDGLVVRVNFHSREEPAAG
jgi:hypothetical protein